MRGDLHMVFHQGKIRAKHKTQRVLCYGRPGGIRTLTVLTTNGF